MRDVEECIYEGRRSGPGIWKEGSQQSRGEGATFKSTLADIQLFGVVSFELTSTAPHQFFLMMVLFTGLLDFFHILGNGFGLQSIVAFIVMCLKVPIYMGGLTNLRSRGGEISWGNQGFAPASTSSLHVPRLYTADGSLDARWDGWWRPDSRWRQRPRSPRPCAAWCVPGRRLPPWR